MFMKSFLKHIPVLFLAIGWMVLATAGAEAATTWSETIGGSGSEMAYSVQTTADGNYITAGTTWSLAGPNRWDAWVVKVSPSGRIVWQKSYGGTGNDLFKDIKQTSDGGFIATGMINTADLWVVKLDADGNVQWQKSYGDKDVDRGDSIEQTADGGYIVAGLQMIPYDVIRNVRFEPTMWLVKLNVSGGIEWQQNFGVNELGSYFYPEGHYRVVQKTDGSYLVSGRMLYVNGGTDEVALISVNGNGSIQWQKRFGAPAYGRAYALQQTKDGGSVFAGSYGGRLWVVKLDADGNALWQKVYNDPAQTDASSIASSVQQTLDNGYVLTGWLRHDRYTTVYDAWALKLDADGTILWQKKFSGGGMDQGSSIRQTPDSGYLLAGFTNSFGAGNYDAWMLKLDADGNTTTGCGFAVEDTHATGADTAAGNVFNVTRRASSVVPRITAAGVGETGASTGGSCTPVVPAIAVTPAVLDFGPLEIPGSATRMLTVTNNGSAALLVAEIGIAGANAGDFSQSNDCGIVSPGGSCIATVTFGAASPGSKNAVLSIASNDPDKPVVSVELKGSALDLVPPATEIRISGEHGNAEWYRTGVAVTLIAADTGSGVREVHYSIDGGADVTIASSQASFVLGPDGTHTVTFFAIDNAGNAETPHPATIMIDTTLPAITAAVGPAPAANGWNTADVTVTFFCSDSGSGIASCPQPVVVTTEGAGQVVLGTAVDNAGNSATASVSLNIDKTAPAGTISAEPGILWPPNHKMVNIAVSGGASDALSGVASVVFTVLDEYGMVQPLVSGFNTSIQLEAWRAGSDRDGRRYTISAFITDNAGNTSTVTTEVVCPHDNGEGSQEQDDDSDGHENDHENDSHEQGRDSHERGDDHQVR